MARKFVRDRGSPSSKLPPARNTAVCRDDVTGDAMSGVQRKRENSFANETPAHYEGNEANEGFPRTGQIGICLWFLGSLCETSTTDQHEFL